MDFDLIVTIPFGDFAVGDRISDPKLVADNIDSAYVVKVPKPASKPAK